MQVLPTAGGNTYRKGLEVGNNGRSHHLSPIADMSRRNHVLQDLQPYVCTFPSCPQSEEFFDNRKTWFEHETQHHRVEFFCNTELHPPVSTLDEFEKHMSQVHGYTPNQTSAMIDLFKRPSKTREMDCNLCGRRTNQIKSHVSRHLQHLALFALPRADYGQEDNADEEASNLVNDARSLASNDERTEWATREELYIGINRVLSVLITNIEFETPFLQEIAERDGPDYYTGKWSCNLNTQVESADLLAVIKQPMDLRIGTIRKKLENQEYSSKQEFADDLNLIWDNCLTYNQDPSHPLRRMANAMREAAEGLLSTVPNVQITLQEPTESIYDDPPRLVRHHHPVRCVNTETLEIEPLSADTPYAILSHTWGDDEITYSPYGLPLGTSSKGMEKVLKACQQARADGYELIWVDTCCIDKTSFELSTAVNEMFFWYKNAAICYAYLEDVSKQPSLAEMSEQLARSRWFTRGWTLQELIAPSHVVFLEKHWNMLGTKDDFQSVLETVTGINREVLCDSSLLPTISVAARMSWAAKRQTTNEEDQSYCLMGIFDVNMPITYGEGAARAFRRLQEEIWIRCHDLSLLAWHNNTLSPGIADEMIVGVLADSPLKFATSGTIIVDKDVNNAHGRVYNTPDPYPLRECSYLKILDPALIKSNHSEDDGDWVLDLDCIYRGKETEEERRVRIYLYPNGANSFLRSGPDSFANVDGKNWPLDFNDIHLLFGPIPAAPSEAT
jgi:hypothetical protein